jgi:hypothetical protein
VTISLYLNNFATALPEAVCNFTSVVEGTGGPNGEAAEEWGWPLLALKVKSE